MSQVVINVENNEITSRVFGCFDSNIKAIERAFEVRISNRRAVDGDAIVIDGHEGEVALASRVLNASATSSRRLSPNTLIRLPQSGHSR